MEIELISRKIRYEWDEKNKRWIRVYDSGPLVNPNLREDIAAAERGIHGSDGHATG